MASGINYSNVSFNSNFAAKEVMRISSNGNVGIGSNSNVPMEKLQTIGQWIEILQLAETNPAVQIALDKLITVYHLSKDYGNNKT